MNRTVSHILIAMACIAAVFAAIAIAVEEATPESNPEYDIEYVLNGGIQNPMNPLTYETGDIVEFQFPFSTEGLYFGGWYADSDLTHLLMSLDEENKGDVMLYAKWQNDPIGITCMMETKIEIECDFDLVLEKERIYTVHGFEDGKVYAEHYYDGEEEWSLGTDWHGWNSETEVIGTETLTTIFGERPCNILKETSTEDMYWSDVEYGWTYKIVGNGISPTSTYTITLKSVGIVEAPEKMTLTVEAESGIASASGGEYSTASEVELSAEIPEGKVFGGWYDSDDDLISEDPVCKYKVYWNDETVFAKYDHDYAYVLTEPTSSITLEYEGPDISWELFKKNGQSVKKGTGNLIEFDFDTTGYYRLSIGDPDSVFRGFVDIKVDIIPEVLSFEWKYKDIEYSYTMKADYEHYLECREYAKDVRDIPYDPEVDRQLILYDDPYIKEIVEMLTSKTAGFSDVDRVNMVMRFVQSPCVPYEMDYFLSDNNVYNKTAYETLFLNGGECYDTSVLLTTLLHEMGYDCALITLYGHAASGVVLEDFEGNGYIKDGVKYLYCESTGEGWTVGRIPVDLTPMFVTVV